MLHEITKKFHFSTIVSASIYYTYILFIIVDEQIFCRTEMKNKKQMAKREEVEWKWKRTSFREQRKKNPDSTVYFFFILRFIPLFHFTLLLKMYFFEWRLNKKNETKKIFFLRPNIVEKLLFRLLSFLYILFSISFLWYFFFLSRNFHSSIVS